MPSNKKVFHNSHVLCGGCPVWWMSGVVDVWCGGCPVWWMSGVVDVLFYTRCGGCLVWWMSVWWMSYNRLIVHSLLLFIVHPFEVPYAKKENWRNARSAMIGKSPGCSPGSSMLAGQIQTRSINKLSAVLSTQKG